MGAIKIWAYCIVTILLAGTLAVSAATIPMAAADGITVSPDSPMRIESYSGVTNGSGLYAVTFSQGWATVPVVIPQPAASGNVAVSLVSVSTSGFTVAVGQQASVTILGLSVPLYLLTPVSGQAVRVVVMGPN